MKKSLNLGIKKRKKKRIFAYPKIRNVLPYYSGINCSKKMDKIHPDIQFLRAVWRSGFIGTFHVAVTTDIFLNFGYNRANFLKFFTCKNSCSQSGVSG